MKTITGMKDLFSEAALYRQIEDEFVLLLEQENFKEIRTPILEEKLLFKRSAGESSDIVEKEMFETTDGYVLRPENTAPIVRSYIENYKKYARYFYFGPQFRKERPQLGRLRQFYQYGFEIFGEKSPQAEIESLLLIKKLYLKLGISNYKIKVNFLGDKKERLEYVSKLDDFFQKNINTLSDISRKRLTKNVLRILDSKDPQDQSVLIGAPKILESLSSESKNNFNQILDIAKDLKIDLEVDPFLVRGLDYYTGFVFEIVDTSNKLGSQSALGGGGRYDSLTKELGGPDSSAFGFAGGLERLLLVQNENYIKNNESKTKIGFVSSQKDSILKFLKFKEENINLYVNVLFDTNLNFKKAFKRADQNLFDFVVIEGSQEFESKIFKIKNLKTGKELSFSNLEEIQKIITSPLLD